MSYKQENVNPKGKKTTDCVVRSIAKATGKSWLEVYDDLFKQGREKCMMPGDPKLTSMYLKDYQTLDVFHETSVGTKRYTVDDVCRFAGTYIVKTAGHMSAVVDGELCDIWDCREKSAYKIWRIR